MSIPFEVKCPTQYVVGSRDPAGTAAFLSVFGVQPRPTPPLAREAAQALYGIDRQLEQIAMSPTGLDGSGTLRIVETPHQSPPLPPFHTGGHGVDIYSRDVELSRQLAAAVGGVPGPTTPYPVEPFDDWIITESRIASPNGDFVVFVSESTRSYPNALNGSSDRMYSDLLTFVWFVEAEMVPQEVEFWTKEVGLDLYAPEPLTFDNTRIATLMGLEREAQMGCVIFTDPDATRRLEILYYEGEKPVKRPDWPLHTGWHSVVFEVTSIEAAVEVLPSVTFTTPTAADLGDGPRTVVSGVSPGGIRFELSAER